MDKILVNVTSVDNVVCMVDLDEEQQVCLTRIESIGKWVRLTNGGTDDEILSDVIPTGDHVVFAIKTPNGYLIDKKEFGYKGEPEKPAPFVYTSVLTDADASALVENPVGELQEIVVSNVTFPPGFKGQGRVEPGEYTLFARLTINSAGGKTLHLHQCTNARKPDWYRIRKIEQRGLITQGLTIRTSTNLDGKPTNRVMPTGFCQHVKATR